MKKILTLGALLAVASLTAHAAVTRPYPIIFGHTAQYTCNQVFPGSYALSTSGGFVYCRKP